MNLLDHLRNSKKLFFRGTTYQHEIVLDWLIGYERKNITIMRFTNRYVVSSIISTDRKKRNRERERERERNGMKILRFFMLLILIGWHTFEVIMQV